MINDGSRDFAYPCSVRVVYRGDYPIYAAAERYDLYFLIRHFYHIAMGQPFTFSFCQQLVPQLYLCGRRTAAHDFHHLLYRFDE